MIRFIEPEERYLRSYMEAYDEFLKQGVSAYGLTDARNCDIFVKFKNYRSACNLPSNRVGCDYYWLVDDARDYFVGEATVRHHLNDALRLNGGHIGYAVRYGEWGKGYATQMLAYCLEKAAARGITNALVTCNDDNIASARVIEKNGFQFYDIVEVEGACIRRYYKALQDENILA